MNWSLDSVQTNFLLFECFQKVFNHSWIRFANDPYRLYHWLNSSRLAQFRKTWKHANQGKTQWWALFVVFQASQHFDFKLKDWMTDCTCICLTKESSSLIVMPRHTEKDLYLYQTANKRLCFQNYCIRLCLMYKPICNCLTPRLKSNDNLISWATNVW